MSYDVFISYSRKDSAIVSQICSAFDRAGISYFIDRQDIAGGFEFPKVLAEAIVASRVVLFVASNNSYSSKFTNAELSFAFNEKPKNTILPYIIDGSTLPLELRLVFAGINWRRLDSHPIEPTLVADIVNMLGCGTSSSDAAKRYNIGDYYNVDGREGIVFDVSEDGCHGTIVSIDECRAQWCSLEQYDREVAVGAASKSDGAGNTSAVLSRNDRKHYPAFLWCSAKGEGWYMPAIEETKAIAEHREAVAGALKAYGATLREWLWSSSEYSGSRSTQWQTPGYKALIMDINGVHSYTVDKHCHYYVRAVARF